MKISANSIRLGNILIYKNDLWQVAKVPEHVKPGKGPAYVQVELKNLKTGTKLNERLNSSDYLDKAVLEQKKCQYLYAEGEEFIFMSMDDYEQIYVNGSILEDQAVFLTDNMEVTLEMHQDKTLQVILPATVKLKIVETPPHIKGATVTSSYKRATLENGVEVMVPPYLEVDDIVVIKTEDKSFVERAK